MKLTVKAVRNELRPLGMQITNVGGEYRVKHVGQRWSEAYFTNDLTDALQTGKRIAEERKRIESNLRKSGDARLRQQIEERDARLNRNLETSQRVNEVAESERAIRSQNLGIGIGGTLVMLNEGDIDDSALLEAMIESTDAAYVDAALRLGKILQKFAERHKADDPRQGEVLRWAQELENESDIERDRR